MIGKVEEIKGIDIGYLIQIPEILSSRKKINSNTIHECDFNSLSRMASLQLIDQLFDKVYYDFLPEDLKEKNAIKKNEVNIKIKKLLEILKLLKKEFDKNGIEFFLIKGFAISQYIFDDYTLRDFNDLDIIIDYTRMDEVNSIMKKIGFESDIESTIIDDLDHLEIYEIEYYYPFMEGGDLSKRFQNRLTVELKKATSSIKDMKLLEKFKSNKSTILIDGIKINTFNVNDTFILLCTNLYGNFQLEFAKLKMRDFIDIYLFIDKYNNDFDWYYILNTCNEFNITHKLFAVFSVINKLYKDRIPDNIMKMFNIENIPYNKSILQNYEHGFTKDWNLDFIDIILSGGVRRRKEIYYHDSFKSYSSRNKWFNKKIYIQALQDVNRNFEYNKKLKGFKSEKNELEYSYRFNHDENKIYFELNFEHFNHDNNMRTVLIIFDINRESPRKMIEFSYNNGNIVSKSLIDNFEYESIENNENYIMIAIPKSQFNVLKSEGRVLSYRMYSVRTYGKVDFAIVDELNTFDPNNPHLLYLNSNIKKMLW